MATITKEIKELSKITSEEWKEWTMTVWNIANISDSVHPAVFPVEIPYRLLRMFSFWGETILDPFSGTGTTGEAALSNGRKYVGFETNSTYYERSTQRLLEVIQNKNIENANEAFVIHNHSCLDMASIPDNSTISSEMNMEMMPFSKSLTLRKDILQEPLPNARAREEWSIDHIELEYGVMHWYRKSN